MNLKLAGELAKSLVLGPVRKILPASLRQAARETVAKVVSLAHKTNASGNNMSQR